MSKFSEELAGLLTNDWLKKEPEKSGFFDLPKQDTCHDSEHKPPSHIHIPQGKGYRHVCPSCGKETFIIPQQISL